MLSSRCTYSFLSVCLIWYDEREVVWRFTDMLLLALYRSTTHGHTFPNCFQTFAARSSILIRTVSCRVSGCDARRHTHTHARTHTYTIINSLSHTHMHTNTHTQGTLQSCGKQGSNQVILLHSPAIVVICRNTATCST